jgi:flavin-binding protein dodecin
LAAWCWPTRALTSSGEPVDRDLARDGAGEGWHHGGGAGNRRAGEPQETRMPDHVYKSIELTGSSTKDIEDAVRTAIAKASESVRNIQWFNIVETRGHVQDGKVAHWQVTLKVGFTLE